MNRLILILILLISLSFASFENVLDGYYQASIDEDYDEYISYIDTSNWNSSDHELMRTIVEGIWENYDIESYSISDLESEQNDEYALVTYNLESKITGIEDIDVSLKYIALMHKVGDQWKIVYNMPLVDYLNFTDNLAYINAYKKIGELEMKNEPQEFGTVLIDGQEPENLESELNEDLNRCLTDEYCRDNNLGEKCINERCVMEPVTEITDEYGICAIAPMLAILSALMMVRIK